MTQALKRNKETHNLPRNREIHLAIPKISRTQARKLKKIKGKGTKIGYLVFDREKSENEMKKLKEKQV